MYIRGKTNILNQNQHLYNIGTQEHKPVNRILVIGCGGTGSNLVPNIAQALAFRNESDCLAEKVELVLIDPDHVEDKNLVRQKFIPSDIGKNKAEVLANRYSAGYGIEIGYIQKELKTIDDFNTVVAISNSNNSGYSNTVIFGCVDNNATRTLIQEYIHDRGRHIMGLWIDAGNEETGGQVFLQPFGLGNSVKFQKITDYYPDMLEDKKFNSDLSCAERAVSAPQSRTVNNMAAMIMTNVFNDLITFDGGVDYFEVIFNTSNIITKTLNYYDHELGKVTGKLLVNNESKKTQKNEEIPF